MLPTIRNIEILVNMSLPLLEGISARLDSIEKDYIIIRGKKFDIQTLRIMLPHIIEVCRKTCK